MQRVLYVCMYLELTVSETAERGIILHKQCGWGSVTAAPDLKSYPAMCGRNKKIKNAFIFI